MPENQDGRRAERDRKAGRTAGRMWPWPRAWAFALGRVLHAEGLAGNEAVRTTPWPVNLHMPMMATHEGGSMIHVVRDAFEGRM